MNLDLKFYLSLFMRRLHWFLLFTVLGTAAGVTLAMVLPPVYWGSAVLVVEGEQIPSNLASSTVQTDGAETLQIIQQRILARERLLDMARELRIYDVPGGEDRANMTADEVVADLRSRISIDTGGRRDAATIVTVAFRAPEPELAARVTNELVTQILEQNVELRTSVAGQTLEFFQEQVARLDQDLSRLSAEILAFQEENLNALPDSLDFRRSQQAALQERLAQLEREEATLKDRRNQLVTLYDTTGRVFAQAEAQMSAEERQLAQLEDELAAALAVLSPQNPRVRLLQSRVAALEAQVARTQAAEGTGDGATPVDPQLSAYELQLADIDGQLEFIADQKTQIAARMEDLRETIEQTPANAIRLQTLERAYAATRARYDQAVANRAAAETGETIEARAKGQRITVIEQASAPGSPASPNRPKIAIAGLAGGMAAGLGIIVLLELLNSSIRRPVDLTAKLGITPFGTLPYIRTRGEIRRRRAIIAGAFGVAAIAVPAGLWWVHYEVMPLDLLIDRAMDRLPSLAGDPGGLRPPVPDNVA